MACGTTTYTTQSRHVVISDHTVRTAVFSPWFDFVLVPKLVKHQQTDAAEILGKFLEITAGETGATQVKRV